MTSEFMTIFDASEWATVYLKKKVTSSNISYLIQYGRVRKHVDSGVTKVSKDELEKYYSSYLGEREINWKAELGDDINWHLSFDFLKETDTTKHVHRLHPYKGKFIPQLVEYFLDQHTDEFKKTSYFKPGDIILDPFCGSGTTLVQANEQGMHAVGIDVSEFNTLISNIKIEKHNFIDIQSEIIKITKALRSFESSQKANEFEQKLLAELNEFNKEYFPSPEFKFKVDKKLINEVKYGKEKEEQFLFKFHQLVNQENVQLQQNNKDSFLDKWYLKPVRQEIDLVNELVNQIKDPATKRVIQIILSRTIRSCRATTHSDLGTLLDPVTTTYYCSKHGKVCKPLFSILSWWERYSKDTLERLVKFTKLRTDTYQRCITGDSRTIEIIKKLNEEQPEFAKIANKQKIQGVFSSPPYVGLIDYHEQHAYAYELFSFNRRDELEIGPLNNGQGKEAKESYIQGISDVLKNCRIFLADDFDIFLVANDKYGMYPIIAERADMEIVEQFKRPVLNRTERDKAAYSESIFHLKSK
ncbi:MAG: restriction endonuclease subunit M [Chloroflexi bacterium GWB2_49_20]|nr:MAG: restriction endonuclease subunit M [Chloroflexi bacterium GWB2_49_20]OGN79127.1 MAG: restriction endonuclease subunit M [Chloroflexi bacterium GWC2_49_37]OGN84923.1 MAG: restriction endonuclease subunit M [Chloroflexi bacterium GWD2_49_16]HCC78015.1 restriction endonuclease subunit M [Anaerolineae bacterium]HCM96633.1 restriction endonuclease subunit M [Anaerolineae bacterium]